MQKSENKQDMPPRPSSDGSSAIPSVHWDDLNRMDRDELGRRSLAVVNPAGSLQFTFLGRELRVDVETRCIHTRIDDHWVKVDHPRLELLTLVHPSLHVPAPAEVDERLRARAEPTSRQRDSGGRQPALSIGGEASRRRVFRVAFAYAMVAMALVTLADRAVSAVELPTSVLTTTLLVLLGAFPVSMVLAWIFDIEPTGVVVTQPRPRRGRRPVD